MQVVSNSTKPYHDTIVFDDNRTQYNAVIRVIMERQSQDAKWGSQRRLSNFTWNAILSEEVGEAAKEVLEKNDALLLEELTQVAAVALCWMESLIEKAIREEEIERHLNFLDGQTEGVSS